MRLNDIVGLSALIHQLSLLNFRAGLVRPVLAGMPINPVPNVGPKTRLVATQKSGVVRNKNAIAGAGVADACVADEYAPVKKSKQVRTKSGRGGFNNRRFNRAQIDEFLGQIPDLNASPDTPDVMAPVPDVAALYPEYSIDAPQSQSQPNAWTLDRISRYYNRRERRRHFTPDTGAYYYEDLDIDIMDSIAYSARVEYMRGLEKWATELALKRNPEWGGVDLELDALYESERIDLERQQAKKRAKKDAAVRKMQRNAIIERALGRDWQK